MYLFVYFWRGLGVTECDRGDVLQYGHLHGTIAPVQQGNQGPRVHRPIGYWSANWHWKYSRLCINPWNDTGKKTQIMWSSIGLWIFTWNTAGYIMYKYWSMKWYCQQGYVFKYLAMAFSAFTIILHRNNDENSLGWCVNYCNIC